MKNKDNDRQSMEFQRVAHYAPHDIIGTLFDSPNRNILCCGISGLSGKTSLLEVLLNQLTSPVECKKYGKEPQNAVIFSPKHFELDCEVDFDLGGRFRIIDCSKTMINAFENIPSLVAAFEIMVNNMMSMQGITASSIGEIAGTVARLRPCKTWDDFRKNAEEMLKMRNNNAINISQLNWIIDKIQYLDVKANTEDIPVSDVIFYLGALDQKARSFYYELFLQKLARELETKKTRAPVLVLDEGHIVLKKNTITETFLRELRTHVVAVWVATQAFDDVDPQLRQFNFEPQGKTSHLEPYSQKPTLRDCIGKLSELENEFPFVDYMFGGSDVVPVYAVSKEAVEKIRQLKQEGLAIRQEQESVKKNLKVVVAPEIEKKKETANEIESKVIEVLKASSTCMYYSEIATTLSYAKDSLERLAVANVLKRLVKEEKILEKDYITATLKKGQKPRHFYFSIVDGESKLHRTLIKDTKEALIKVGIEFEEGVINQGFDIYITDKENPRVGIEDETGLKHSLKEYDEKVNASAVPVITVVCNEQDRERYSYLTSVSLGKTKIVLLNELAVAVKEYGK